MADGAERCEAPGAVEAVAAAYLRAAQGDARTALRLAVADALAALDAAERAKAARERLISRGFVRGASPPA